MHAGRDEHEGTLRRTRDVLGCGRPLRAGIAFLAAALGGLPLYGCAEPPPDQDLASELAPVVSPAPNIPQVAVPPPPEPKAAPKRHPRTAKNTEQPARNAERKVAAVDPVTLVGLAPPAIGNILGRPVDARESALTVEWIYATRSCSLVVVFYPDITTGTLHALKFNVIDAEGKGDGASCIHHILLARSNDDD